MKNVLKKLFSHFTKKNLKSAINIFVLRRSTKSKYILVSCVRLIICKVYRKVLIKRAIQQL